MPAGEQVELIGRDTDVIERAGIEAVQLAHRAKIADLLAQPAQHAEAARGRVGQRATGAGRRLGCASVWSFRVRKRLAGKPQLMLPLGSWRLVRGRSARQSRAKPRPTASSRRSICSARRRRASFTKRARSRREMSGSLIGSPMVVVRRHEHLRCLDVLRARVVPAYFVIAGTGPCQSPAAAAARGAGLGAPIRRSASS